MANLALLDLIAPYVLRGENLGAQHAALSAIRVVAYESAADDLGAVIRGRCEFNGRLSVDLGSGGLRVDAGVDEGAAAFDPNRREPVFDIRETAIEFELHVPRAGSSIVAAGAASITAPGFTPTRDVLDSWDALPLDPDPTDYPATGFTLDLLLDAPSLRPPFLHPAKVDEVGTLMPDTSVSEVAITLPRLRFRLAHGNAAGSQLTFELLSAGVTSLDDPGDIGVAELISMQPPYAFIGGPTDRTWGIGFRSATLDLSNDSTPPALLAKTGVGDDWTGLYLPEVRVFVAPEGARDFAFEAGANELLLGFGEDDGFWGDFEAALINQGSGELKIGARFIGPDGKSYGIERTGALEATARIPERTRMVVDVTGGRTPYTRRVSVGGGAEQTGMAFDVDLSANPQQDIVVRVTDASATPVDQTLTIHAERREATPTLPTPGEQPAGDLTPTIDPPAGTPNVVIVSDSGTEVLLRVEPADADIRWTLDGGAETGGQAAFAVPLAPGQTRTVKARKPGTPAVAPVDFYFYFDEPADPGANEEGRLRDYAAVEGNVSTRLAVSKVDRRRDGASQDPTTAHGTSFDAAPAGSALVIRGEASFEGTDDATQRRRNYLLARRRALAVAGRIQAVFPTRNFDVSDIAPKPKTVDDAAVQAWATSSGWTSHAAPGDREWWKATVTFPPGMATADTETVRTLKRPAAAQPPAEIVVKDPPVPVPEAPDWFRSVKLKLRVVRSELIALEMEGEVDFQTATEEKLSQSGQLEGNPPPEGHSLVNGAPIGPDNPADGITKFRLLCQSDPGTGRTTTLISVGADPADKDGLAYWGWVPGEAIPAAKSYPVTLLGSYLTFWPLLVNAAEGGKGAFMDAMLTAAAVEVPAIIALLPMFRVERVIVFGAEYVQRDRGDEFEANLLFDIGIDWSANIIDLITIEKEHPLSVRYKAIGLRLGNRSDDGTPKFALRPVFDSSRGYTIDLASGGALKVAEPFDKILRVLGARLSKTNPLTLEIDIGLGVDLGVVSVDRASVRVYLDEPRPPELTALAAHVDVPGALVGSGYVQIGSSLDAGGNTISTIGGQVDLTLRPLSLRVTAAVEIAEIPAEAGGPATGVYVGLNVVLPVGLPLANSGFGIFGFRGIFGMHYERNPAIGVGSGAPALAWLEAAQGKPHLLVNPDTQQKLWVPHVDQWAFGLGMLIGTMEGGVVMNLDGTLLLELPGPRLLIMLNARIISPPPTVDELGMTAGILAVIEITPEHLLIGILIQWEIEKLIKIVIPVEAVFPFPPHLDEWHIYLGARKDLGRPVEVDVLGIVKGTGYLMFKGDGLPVYQGPNFELPAITGFGIGLGVAASFTWGDTDIGLYLRVGGGMDAVLGLDPFVLAGAVYVSGELRLFIVSVGADAKLEVQVNEQPDGSLALFIHGEACGHVSFFFFDVEGCVDITISGPSPAAAMPVLVEKVAIKSRSPALLAGTGVDRGVDVSLGDAVEQDAMPALTNPDLVVVPIDAIPVISMRLPPLAAPGLTVTGLGTAVGSPNAVRDSEGFADRGGESYRYELTAVALERIDPDDGTVLSSATQGGTAPAVWWTLHGATEPNAVAQLALMTWEPTPATKAIEKSEHLEETIRDRWSTVCEDAAPPADVLWTFRWEPLGASAHGWALEGIAWPDPPGTVRTTPPDTALDVTERWRSGDPILDGLRGIFPALVLGGAVPCSRTRDPDRPIEHGLRHGAPVPRLVVGGLGPVEPGAGSPTGMAVDAADPVFAQLGARDDRLPVRISAALHARVAATVGTTTGAIVGAMPIGPGEVARRLNQGEPLDRHQLQAAFGAQAAAHDAFAGATAAPARPEGTPAAAAAARTCQVRVLEAPMLDDGRVIVFGDQARAEEAGKRLEELGVSHGPLDDVVVLHSGGVASVDLLLFVRRDVLERRRLVARAVDAAGNELASVAATASDVTPPKPLPAHWTDPAGPWVDGVAELLAWQQRSKWVAVYLRLPRMPDAERIEIGTLHEEPPREEPGAAGNDEPILPAYYVAAIGILRWTEVTRADSDQTQIDQDRSIITNFLGPASSDNALLHADSLYRISTTWKGERDSDGETTGSRTQHFWFRTDRIGDDGATPPVPIFLSTPPVPVRLDAWMLVTLPADHESAVFAGEPTRLVFNTLDVDRVFAAYGRELRVRFQASSGRHPEEQPGVPHPFPISGATVVPVAATILSPWEEAAVEVLADSCIPIDVDRSRHSEVDIPIPLELFTDYILDVEMVAVGAPAEAKGPSIYRRHFSTGGFTSFDDFAASLQAPRPTVRSCEPGALEAIRAHFAGRAPLGAELDDHLRAHGMEPLAVPEVARVVVFWSQEGDDPPQPAGILIDATEPLWRSRPYPSPVEDDTGPVTVQRWVQADTEWMMLEDRSAAGVIAADGIIRAPGLQRALIVLAAGARGATVKIELVSRAFPTMPFLNQVEKRAIVVGLTLDHALWEEV